MALVDSEFDRFFVQAVRALEPCLDRVVIVGGCANALYRFVPHVRPGPTPLLTYDLDVATPNKIPDLDISLGESLKSAGLRPVPESQPTNKYAKPGDTTRKLEFICPTEGLSKAAKRKVPTLVPIHTGATAEALDFAELRLVQPLSVDLRAVPELGVRESLVVKIPHPILYVIQKALIRDNRRDKWKRAKDSYYTYEVAVLSRDQLKDLMSEVMAESALTKKRLGKAARILSAQFGHEAAEGVTETIDVGSDSSNVYPLDACLVLQEIGKLIKTLEDALSVQKGK